MSAATTSPATSTRNPPWRRFFRFNLRSALLLVAIVCAFLAWISRDMHLAVRRSRLTDEVARLGGRLHREPVAVPRYAALRWIANGWDPELTETVRGVSVFRSDVTDDDVARLAPLIRALPEVQWLRMAHVSAADKSGGLLATCPHLRSIDLAETAIADGGLAPLAQLTNLESLSLAGTAIGDEGVLRLQPLPNLKVLDLSRTNVTDRSLAAAGGWPKLKELRLRGTGVTDAGVLALQRRLPMLQVQVVADRYLPSYYEMSKNNGLILREPFFTDAYLECFEDLQFPYHVDLCGSCVTAQGLRDIAHTSIGWTRKLSLAGAAIDDRALEAIGQWRGIEELTLRDTIVTDAGLAHLANLPRLKMLWLTGAPVTDDGLAHVGRLSELEFLDLSMTKIEGTGLGHLAGLTKLGRLALVQTAITDDSLRNLPPLPALEILDLERTEISDRGVEHLQAFPRLREVNGRQSKISASAQESFTARQPPAKDGSSVRSRDSLSVPTK